MTASKTPITDAVGMKTGKALKQLKELKKLPPRGAKTSKRKRTLRSGVKYG